MARDLLEYRQFFLSSKVKKVSSLAVQGAKSSIPVWSLLKAIKREKQEPSNHHVVQGRKIYQVQVHIGAKGIPANLSLHHNE